MKKSVLFIAFILSAFAYCSAQQSKGIYNEPLTEVLPKVEKTYHVRFVYEDGIVNGLKVYASKGFTADFKNTLDNIIKPLGLVYNKISKDTYTITQFEVNHKRTVEEGAQQLGRLLTLYSNDSEFNRRKRELYECIFKALGINSNLKGGPFHSIFLNKKVMNGYTVQNIAFESMPGYYVTGTLYKPIKSKGPFAVILCPHGHFYNETDRTISQDSGRYASDMQIRCAVLAKMGAIVLNYDMYSWGESVLQSGCQTYHYTSFSMAIQTWNSIRCLDFLLSLPNVDKSRVGVTGASGGGTQTILVSALDSRVTASVPVVMVSSSFDGGCECESGLPIHECGKYENNNVEIAAMMAPRPQLLISEDADWTKSFPKTDYPYLQKIYAFYGKKANVENVHLHDKHHDYSYTKRFPMYQFFSKIFGLDLKAITTGKGNIDESFVTIQNNKDMLVFLKGLPADALRSDKEIEEVFADFQKKLD
jgi:hypothetical protein